MPRRLRTVTSALPAELDTLDGLAYSLWLPPDGKEPKGGVVIIHGAGSCKESHHDFARFVLPAGHAAIAFDLRGHGESTGPMDAHLLDDVALIAGRLRQAIRADAPIALRGSSMGGYIAILAARAAEARAVVAICPASAGGLRRGLKSGAFEFDADVRALDAFLAEHELSYAVANLRVPLLLLHAEGDEQVPVEHSRELAEHFALPESRLITLPGGHHRSIQHDAELQAVSLRWMERALGLR